MEYVKSARVLKGLTSVELARKLNLTTQYYKKVELEEVPLSSNVLKSLIKVLKLDLITCKVLWVQDRQRESQTIKEIN